MTSYFKKVRIELAIFFILFATYGYFHQGGAWGQNSRFAQIRAVVEEGRFSINNYVAYQAGRDGASKLSRLALSADARGQSLSANTGDLSFFDGKLYPNKPPGAVLAAVPAYLSIYHVERALGIDPDEWWTLTINAYLTTLFSVGLLAALAGVVFYRVSLQLFPSAPLWTHAASTFVFGLATLMLPFATMLYDHDIAAALSLSSFGLLLLNRKGLSASPELLPNLAGALAGLTLLMHYSSFISVTSLTLYAIWVVRPWHRIAFFVGAMALPLCFLAWYHWFCFGSVFATASSYQNEIFGEPDTLLFGMFGIPRFDVMSQLLISSYRGLFFTSPILALSFVGFWRMAVRQEWRGEFLFCVSIFFGFLLLNGSFNNWQGGWSMGPRYLIPALPFLALPLTLVFGKLPRLSLVLAALSAIMMLFVTAVDPQPFGGIQKPLTDYIWPLLWGKAFVVGDTMYRGPVSANPIGVYESWRNRVNQQGSMESDWNSFNLGEFFWSGSLLSLLPLCFVLALGLGAILRWSRR